jgi:Amiloride-sensitive sodium channel
MLAIDTFCPEQAAFDDPENMANCNECLATLREIRIPPEEMFLECKFQNQVINCTEVFEETITEVALCYTFNGLAIYRSDSIRRDQDWSNDRGYQPTSSADAYPRRALGAGRKFGLSVLLRMNREDIDYTCFGTTGFWVYKSR